MTTPLRLRQLRSPVGKGNLTPHNSDLALLWDNFQSPSPSPPRANGESDSPTILTLLSTHASVSTPKKLSCPPCLAPVVVEKAKDTVLEFAYSSVCLSSPRPIVVPEEVLERRFFAFKGVPEQQAAAWRSFMEICKSAECALVACVNTIFFFNAGRVSATGLTGTAHRRLAQLSQRAPEIEHEVAIQVVTEWIEKERTFMYSSEPFDYSVITPLVRKNSELQSSSGKIHRVTLCGCLFAPTVAVLKERNPEADVTVSVLKF
jgi:hypothetical protein